MTPRIVAVEGGHGAGKDVLAAALAKAIGAERFQHDRPADGATVWEAALYYALQRAVMLRELSVDGVTLIVSSRWSWSTGVLASVLDDEALRLLRQAERAAVRDPLVTLVCDAPEDVLRARVEARGETWGEREAAERAEVLRLARLRGWPVLDTTRPRDVVLAEALACAGRAGADGR